MYPSRTLSMDLDEKISEIALAVVVVSGAIMLIGSTLWALVYLFRLL